MLMAMFAALAVLQASQIVAAFQPSSQVVQRVWAPVQAPVRTPASSMLLQQLAARLNPTAAEDALFRLLASGSKKRPILDAFKVLEEAAPAADDLLLSEQGATLIDGRWTLLGTIAATVDDEEELADSGIANAVNASGIVVDASGKRKPIQQIDVGRKRIANELYRPLPFGQSAIIRVAGSFAPRPEEASGKRAYVNFDALEFFLETDSGAIRLLSLGVLFSFIKAVRPFLNKGDTDGPWLETTYLTERVRLGRGNKGSIFVLEKSDAEAKLAEYPL
mmetsp:Transcript_100789/g.178828  ORF Transcript_100789/g.178828 Transcript_100789/m.178828 type:complete len:277 (+) Transcript_100789:61-891(+)